MASRDADDDAGADRRASRSARDGIARRDGAARDASDASIDATM